MMRLELMGLISEASPIFKAILLDVTRVLQGGRLICQGKLGLLINCVT